jgi:hypothetical protein
MSLLLSMMVYLIVGCGEWYLALRRTLACARGEKVLLVSIVFIENLLGLWVLSNFIRTNNWTLALCYSAGASAGALIIAMNSSKVKPAHAAQTSASPRSRPEANRAVAQTQGWLFETAAESQEDSDHRALEHARAAMDMFHRMTVKSPEVSRRERPRTSRHRPERSN